MIYNLRFNYYTQKLYDLSVKRVWDDFCVELYGDNWNFNFLLLLNAPEYKTIERLTNVWLY
jgi:hypothetical protein